MVVNMDSQEEISCVPKINKSKNKNILILVLKKHDFQINNALFAQYLCMLD